MLKIHRISRYIGFCVGFGILVLGGSYLLSESNRHESSDLSEVIQLRLAKTPKAPAVVVDVQFDPPGSGQLLATPIADSVYKALDSCHQFRKTLADSQEPPIRIAFTLDGGRLLNANYAKEQKKTVSSCLLWKLRGAQYPKLSNSITAQLAVSLDISS